MQIRVKDFQIIKNLNIKLEGITLITGKSDSGKSSVMRAISSCLFGSVGNTQIRNGEKHYTVTCADSDVTITRKRTKTLTSYIIDGVSYEKVGRNKHLDIIEKHGIKLFGEIQLNIINQFDSLFLLGFTPSESFTVLSNVFEDEKYNEAIKIAGLEVRAINKRIDIVQESLVISKAAADKTQTEYNNHNVKLVKATPIIQKLADIAQLCQTTNNLINQYNTAQEGTQKALDIHVALKSKADRLAPIVKQCKDGADKVEATSILFTRHEGLVAQIGNSENSLEIKNSKLNLIKNNRILCCPTLMFPWPP